MLKFDIRKWLSYINITRLKDDAHKCGIACIGIGFAGLFLNAYSKYSDSYFWTTLGVGAVFWLFGLIKRGSHS